MCCNREQVRSAVADLYLLKEHISPKDALSKARARALRVQDGNVENKEVQDAIDLAEALLRALGPGEEFKTALEKVRSSAWIQGPGVPSWGTSPAAGAVHCAVRVPQGQIQVLQLEAIAAAMRSQPTEALRLAEEFSSRILAMELSTPPSRAQAHCLSSVSHRLCGDETSAIEAAQKLVQLGKDVGQSELEAYGEILIASIFLDRAPPDTGKVPLQLHHLQLLRGSKELNRAHAAAERALQIAGSWPKSLTFVQTTLQGAALLRLSLTLSRKGQGEDAKRQVEQLGVGEAAALGAMASLAAAQGTIEASALKRLETLGTDGEGARMEVAFLAAKYWRQQQDLADATDFESWDNATTSLQQALALARARQDFISEVTALHLLTQLHRQIGLQPPRSQIRSRISAQLRAAAERCNELQQVLPLAEALGSIEAAGYKVHELLAAADIREAMVAIEFSADWWEAAKAQVPAVLIPAAESATNGHVKGPRLSMVEVPRDRLYCDVRVAGVQYGPRYRQVQGFIPPGRALSSKPAVVGVLRSSSEAEEWEARSLGSQLCL